METNIKYLEQIYNKIDIIIFMDYKQLNEHIKQGTLNKVYLLFGDQRYLMRFYLNMLVETVLKPEFASFNLTKFSGVFDENTVSDACATYPVFDEKRIVICENTNLFKVSKKADGEFDLNKFIENIPEETCLIFVEEDVSKIKREYKCIDKLDGAVEFKDLTPIELKKWIAKIFKQASKSATNEAIEQLIKCCSSDMDEILNEANKIINLAGSDENIDFDAVDAICTKTIKTRIFDLTDAIGNRNVKRAISVLDDMISLNEPVQKIFIMLANHFRTLSKIRHLYDNGGNNQSICKDLSLKPGFYSDKLVQQAKKFELDKLNLIVKNCADYDVAIKTGNINDRIAIELIISSLI